VTSGFAVVGGGVVAGLVADELIGRGHNPAEGPAELVVICEPPVRAELVDVLAAARRVVLASLVGCDVIPSRAHRAALEAERRLTTFRVDSSVIRFTETHRLLWERYERRSRLPLVVAPAGVRYQPIDEARVASVLADVAEAGSDVRRELGGRFAYESRQLARSVMVALGRGRPVLGLNAPGIRGAAYRAGANLTPDRDDIGATWNDFVVARSG